VVFAWDLELVGRMDARVVTVSAVPSNLLSQVGFLQFAFLLVAF
jgi:hypothetical protein